MGRERYLMEINGTLVNYYFHCKRQCYLHGNRINLEDNSEIVKVGKALHERNLQRDSDEIAIENIKLDKLTKNFLVEIKKSDADAEAASWQLLYYLKILKEKGIKRKGKLKFIEKNKSKKKTIIVDLTADKEKELQRYVEEIKMLLDSEEIPERLNKTSCRKCSYYEYCYI